MAKFNSNVIFTMTRELSELHQIGLEMIKRIGQCEFVSWRYPNQPIQDIVINVNAEFYNTQEKYTLLMELIIDRLYLIINMAVLLLNGVKDITNKALFELPKNISRPPGISLGTVLSLFWRRLEALVLVHAQRSKKSSSKNNSKVSVGDFSSTNSLLISSRKTTKSKSCENCPAALSLIKSLINNIMDCMGKQNIESKTQFYRKNIQKSLIKSNQSAVLSEWNDALISDINSLTQNSINISSENAFLSRELKEQKDENEDNLKQIRILQKKCGVLEKENESHISQIKKLTKNLQELQLNYNAIFTDLERSRQISTEREMALKSLEGTYNASVNSFEETTKNLHALVAEKDEIFENEKAYWTDMCNQCINQIEELKNNIAEEQKEHENRLKEAKATFNEEKAKLEDKNVQLQTQKKALSDQIYQLEMQEYQYKEKIHDIEERKKNLKYEIKVLKERETVLLRCPDLNGPIISQDKQNPLEDMKAQITANEIRIKLLQDQTLNLKKVVIKMANLSNIKQ